MLARQPFHVGVVQLLTETVRKAALSFDGPPPPHIVRPEGDIFEIWRPKTLQEAVERFVSVLKLPILPPHKRKPTQKPGDDVITFTGLHHMSIHMRTKGNKVAVMRVGIDHKATRKEISLKGMTY